MAVFTFNLVVPVLGAPFVQVVRPRVVTRELAPGVSLICGGCGVDSAPLSAGEVNDLLHCKDKNTGWICHRCCQRAMRGAYVPHACA